MWLQNAKQAFDILLQIGAGTGLIFIIRWFWWRINAYTEISAMVISFIVAVFFKLVLNEPAAGMEPQWYHMSHWQLVAGIIITTITWLTLTYLTRPEDEETLKKFVKLTRPGGGGWKLINQKLEAEGHEPIKHQLALEIFCMTIGIVTVYSALFATGFWIYGQIVGAGIGTGITIISAVILFKAFGKLKIG